MSLGCGISPVKRQCHLKKILLITTLALQLIQPAIVVGQTNTQPVSSTVDAALGKLWQGRKTKEPRLKQFLDEIPGLKPLSSKEQIEFLLYKDSLGSKMKMRQIKREDAVGNTARLRDSLNVVTKGADYKELKGEATQINDLWNTYKANSTESPAAKSHLIELCGTNGLFEAVKQHKVNQGSP